VVWQSNVLPYHVLIKIQFSNNTTEMSGEAFLSTSNVVKPLDSWGSAPEPAGELTALPQTP